MTVADVKQMVRFSFRRPLPRAVHDTKNVDGRLVYAIDQEIRRTRNDKFARAGDTAVMPDAWEAS